MKFHESKRWYWLLCAIVASAACASAPDRPRRDAVAAATATAVAAPGYREIEVAFSSTGANLAGTLTVPEGPGPAPAVVLISGSGPQDRDETLFEMRPFRELAHHLAAHGIASLRYDDRGTARSTGDFASATAADFADDAEAGVRLLFGRSEVDARRIGVLGHSEGGIVGPIVAARVPAIAFVVMWAGPAVPITEGALQQTRDMLVAEGAPPGMVAREVAIETEIQGALRTATSAEELGRTIRARVERSLAAADLKALGDLDAWTAGKVKRYWRPWVRWYLTYDPRTTLARVKCPVLAVSGGMDVIVAPKPNLASIDATLRANGNTDVEIVELPGLNHIFQPTKTGAMSEYAKNPPRLDPAVLEKTSTWIAAKVGRPRR